MKKLTTQQKRTKLRKKADKLYQTVGRLMYEDKGCLIDGCNEPYSCLHHYYPKSTCSALRYNLKNGIRICAKHHLRIHASDDPTINNQILRINGMEWLEELEAIKRNTFIKTSLSYYEKVISDLEKTL